MKSRLANKQKKQHIFIKCTKTFFNITYMFVYLLWAWLIKPTKSILAFDVISWQRRKVCMVEITSKGPLNIHLL